MGRDVVSPTSDVLLYFLAIFIPPLAVFMKRGCTAALLEWSLLWLGQEGACADGCGSTDFWINICLWILGWIPGVIHAWYIISRSEGAM
ncbi:hypothetical protein CVT26_007039 [Gymnopilus dilepis]|uniref:Plasma membrane proteolipid 3 n=1 Tax=Gymnopilus dilepis TaxID=231916 RepID=A0A409VNA4_9AGAR|nr:hypothetical protein CVT26_007039 [Gymnopilus dilepis]